jgi:hypothetical protein
MILGDSSPSFLPTLPVRPSVDFLFSFGLWSLGGDLLLLCECSEVAIVRLSLALSRIRTSNKGCGRGGRRKDSLLERCWNQGLRLLDLEEEIQCFVKWPERVVRGSQHRLLDASAWVVSTGSAKRRALTWMDWQLIQRPAIMRRT